MEEVKASVYEWLLCTCWSGILRLTSRWGKRSNLFMGNLENKHVSLNK
jgi:hypothetical protein